MFLYIQKRPCERRALGYYNVRYAHICKYWMMKKENRGKENRTEVLILLFEERYFRTKDRIKNRCSDSLSVKENRCKS